jgi:hypothetical protein
MRPGSPSLHIKQPPNLYMTVLLIRTKIPGVYFSATVRRTIIPSYIILYTFVDNLAQDSLSQPSMLAWAQCGPKNIKNANYILI